MTTNQQAHEPVTRQIGATTLTLSSPTEIVMTRIFEAPRALVFRAHSSCEHIRRWWGRREDTVTACQMDFRPGGSWRYVLGDDEGNEIAFFGKYGTIIEPERIDWTFGFEGMEGEPGPETMTLEELEGDRTLLRTYTALPSQEVRDAVIATGMESGASEMWDKLAEHLATMS